MYKETSTSIASGAVWVSHLWRRPQFYEIFPTGDQKAKEAGSPSRYELSELFSINCFRRFTFPPSRRSSTSICRLSCVTRSSSQQPHQPSDGGSHFLLEIRRLSTICRTEGRALQSLSGTMNSFCKFWSTSPAAKCLLQLREDTFNTHKEEGMTCMPERQKRTI